MDQEPIPRVRQTPHGPLYRPQREWVQFVILIGVFFSGFPAGDGLGMLLGGLSENGQIAVYIPFFLILFGGYALWSARLSAIAFTGLTKGLLRFFWRLLIRRKKPESMQDVLPDAAKWEEMAVKAQRAGFSFFPVGIAIGAASGLLAAILADRDALTRGGIVLGAYAAWGLLLGLLARRGFLPIMESD